MKRIFSILSALALVASLGVGTAVSAESGSTTWYVVEGGAGDRTGVSSDEAFADIQNAIDAADDGDTIMVASGRYDAFLVVGKTGISIIGAEGATVGAADWVSVERGPIGPAWSMAAVKDSQDINIQGIDFDGIALSHEEVVVGIAFVDSTGTIADLSVENVAGAELGVGVAIIGEAGTSVVTLGGVTVRESMAGVIIWDAEANINGCTFSLMRPNGGFGVMGSGVGMVIGIPGEAWWGPSAVKVKGSTISDNNDIGIYVCDHSVLVAGFNNIVGNEGLGVLNDGGQRVDATYNWWGHASGPFHPTENVGGRGNGVSNDVDFSPWVAAGVVTRVVTDSTVDARGEADTEVGVTGTARITVAKYPDNPADDAPPEFVTLGKHIDVYVPDTDQVTEIEIRLYYTAAEVGDVSEADQKYFRLLWWNGTEWVMCSDTGADTTLDYIWAKVTRDTTPSLDDLEGTPFGGYAFSPGVPQPWCFIATAAYGTDTATEIDILREFRDVVLLPDSLGARFVSLYYATSPPMADFISRHEVLTTVLRVGFVDPVVAVLTWSQDLWLGTSS